MCLHPPGDQIPDYDSMQNKHGDRSFWLVGLWSKAQQVKDASRRP